jgi:hypothetical protein
VVPFEDDIDDDDCEPEVEPGCDRAINCAWAAVSSRRAIASGEFLSSPFHHCERPDRKREGEDGEYDQWGDDKNAEKNRDDAVNGFDSEVCHDD